MAKFEEAIVHVGLHKTGSTSIQEALYANRDSLEANFDIKYPSICSNHSIFLYSMFCDQPHEYSVNIRAGISSTEAAALHNQKLAKKVAQELDETLASRLLLSGEDISHLSLDGLNRFYAWLSEYTNSIKIIVFLREPVGWSTSSTQHLVQVGRTLEQIALNPPLQQIKRKMGNIIDVFGKHRLRVLDFDGIQRQESGLIGGFCDLLGFSPDWHTLAESKHKNRSLSQEAVELISALNKSRPQYINGQIGPMRMPGDIERLSGIAGRKFELDLGVLQSIDSYAREDVEWVAHELGITLAYSSPDFKADGQSLERDSKICLGSEQAALLLSDCMIDAKMDVLWFGGMLAISRGDYKSAASNFVEMVRIMPRRADAYRQLSNIYQALGSKEKAIVAARKAVELDPKNTEYNVRLKNLLG